MYLSTKEVAKILGYTTRNVSYLVKSGKINPINSHKDYFLFDAEEIQLFNSKRTKQ
jgi:DNA-binding transcriptional MerR regulator